MRDAEVWHDASLPPRQIRAICIEPQLSTIKLLAKSFDALGYSSSIELVHAAASSAAGRTRAIHAGQENLGLATSEEDVGRFASGTDAVEVTTLDQLLLSRINSDWGTGLHTLQTCTQPYTGTRTDELRGQAGER